MTDRQKIFGAVAVPYELQIYMKATVTSKLMMFIIATVYDYLYKNSPMAIITSK